MAQRRGCDVARTCASAAPAELAGAGASAAVVTATTTAPAGFTGLTFAAFSEGAVVFRAAAAFTFFAAFPRAPGTGLPLPSIGPSAFLPRRPARNHRSSSATAAAGDHEPAAEL